MIQTFLADLIGQAPEGAEIVTYVFAFLVVVFILAEMFAFLHNLFRSILSI